MNITILCGNVGQDPKITNFENGGKIAQFTLATTERGYTTREGREIPDTTTWHNIVIKHSGLAEVAQRFVKKGTKLVIMGKTQTREYQDAQGQTRYVTEIIVDSLELCGGRENTAPGFAPASA